MKVWCCAVQVGMLVVKIGGPAYRIGIGGGAASSVPGGSRGGEGDLDFNAVQRGDAEMSQKLWRVVRTCVELGADNPIVQVPPRPSPQSRMQTSSLAPGPHACVPFRASVRSAECKIFL
jgi:hypothetical protein